MTHCVASNKIFNLIYEIGAAITSSEGYGEEQKKHTWEDALQPAKACRNINLF